LRLRTSDAVVVAIATTATRVSVLQTLQAGKHVFVEKPLAITTEENRRDPG